MEAVNIASLLFLTLYSMVFSFPRVNSDKFEMRTIFNFMSEEDFTEADINKWWESSDTVREPGKSKASFVLQKSRLFQRAIFFALLNPQPNGAGFAGVKTDLSLDLGETRAESEGFLVQCRAQGNLNYWKIVLTNKEFSGQQAAYSYEAKFLVELNSENVETIMIPFNNFQAYYRGSIVEDAPPLDLEKIGTFGLQTFGGVYDEFKQSGVGSLEIDLIALY